MVLKEHQLQTRPPYLPEVAPPGGIPTIDVDIPVCAVLLVLYLLCLLTHGLIYHRNNANANTKFRLSILIIYMCLLRLVTLSLRIAWATNNTNTRVVIAAQVFTYAGVLLLFVLNLVFCQRIMRAWHPHFGWSLIVSWTFPMIYATIPLTLVAVITSLVLSEYTLDRHTRQVDHAVQMYGVTFFLVIAVFPLPFILINSLLLRAKNGQTRYKESPIQHPTMAGKVGMSAGIVACATLILVIVAGFRTGTSWANPAPPNHPAWYDSKACFYLFTFVPELVVVLLYAVVRVDKLFFVPDRSEGHTARVVTGLIRQKNATE